MLVIGLTGGIGSGKSMVAKMFAELGIDIIDTDAIARQLLISHQDNIAKVVEKFGDSILSADGSIDRQRLRTLIFADEQAKLWLEQLLHPQIRQRMAESIQQAQSPYVICDIPLLLETGNSKPLIDRILVVDVPEELQISRVCQRDNCSVESVKAIMQQQVSRQQRLAAADDVIDNSGDIAKLQLQVNELHRQYCLGK